MKFNLFTSRASLKAFLTACFFALFLTACSSSGNSTPESAVKAFFEGMASKDKEKVLSVMVMPATTDAEKNMADAKISMMIEMAAAEFEKKGGLKDIVIRETTNTDENNATVAYTIQYGDGSSKDDSMKLEKVEGKWLLNAK